MELLERDGDREVLSAAIEESRSLGRIVVVVGEAGIGKTALVTAGCEALDPRRVLWGACDPLITPRPMGPLRDVARQVGGPMLDAIEDPGSPTTTTIRPRLRDSSIAAERTSRSPSRSRSSTARPA